MKTLKDIEEESINNILIKHYNLRLKAEAVKWIKDFDWDNYEGDAIDWITNFFNLTEEDLK